MRVAVPQSEKAVASVGVFDGDKLLMGRRRDSNKYTLPGGHFEPGEYALEAGIRELQEEAGIEVASLIPLGMKPVRTPEGVLDIHAFEYHCDKTPTVKYDPDEEVKKWEWIDVSNGLPEDVLNNLHSKKNVVLQLLGLQKSFGLYITEPEYFITDILKARPHKYMRKYKKGDKWIYIYHQGDEPGKRLTPAQVETFQKLKETGHESSKRLLDGAEEHKAENIRRLAELHETGHPAATEWLRRHALLDIVEQGQLEHVIDPERANDPFLRDLTDDQKARVTHEIEVALRDSIFGYLDGHRSTPFYTNLQRDGVNIASIMEEVEVEDSLSDIISALDEALNQVDAAHRGLSPQNARARDAGGYGNLGFNTAMNRLVGASALPEEAEALLTRTEATRGRISIDTAKLKRAKQEQERRQREEAERLRREHGEIVEKHGESARKMMSYYGASLSEAEQVKLMKGIDKFFGKDFKFDSMVEAFQGHPDVEIRIERSMMDGLIGYGAGAGQRSISLRFTFKERSSGRKITAATRHMSKSSNGAIVWHNEVLNRAKNNDLAKYPKMATGLYGGVERFLKQVTANYSPAAKKDTLIEIGGCANSGFGNGYKGALVWTKHFFDFPPANKDRYLGSWKDTWKRSIDKYARALGTPASEVAELKRKIDSAEYPYQFTKTGFVLTREQAEKVLRADRKNLDFDFNQLLKKRSKGGTATPYIDIGELIMIHSKTSWGDAKNYINRTTGRAGHLNEQRTKMYNRQQQVAAEKRFLTGTGTSRPRTPTATTRTSTGNRGADAMRAWAPGGSRRRIAITEPRLAEIRTWTSNEIRDFVRRAPITDAARARIRAILGGRNA